MDGLVSKYHARLIDRQTTEELRRKAEKARQRGLWTQEDIDYGNRRGREMAAWFREHAE